MARKGKIDELYDLAAIEKQQEKVVAYVQELANTIEKFKPVTIKLEGAEKTKEVIDGMKQVSQATQQVADVSGKAVNAMGQLVDMSNKAAGSYEKQETLIKKFAGTLDQNIKLQTSYKIRLDEISKALKEQKDEYAKGTTSLESYTQKVAILTKEQQELKVASSEIGQTIKAQVKDSQAAEESYDSLNHRLGLLRDAYRQLSAEERNSDAGKALLAQIQPLDAKLKELDAGIGNFQRNVGNYGNSFSGALKTLEGALQEVKQKMDDMNQSGNVNAETMASLQREYELLSQVVGSQSEGFTSMRQEIRANEQAIEQLISVYGQDSEVVQKLIHQNAELRDSFSDLVQTQKTLGSDTFTWDAMLQGGQALIGLYSAAQGAAALFGDENEDLQKTMVKLQAAMALVQGVQAAVNVLQKEGALVQGLLAVRTAALSIAMRVYSFVTAGATTAARTFNTVLLASGIGIVLTLIATAANAMGVFSDSTDDATKSQKELNAELEETRKKLNEVADASEKARNAQSGGLNDLKRELQLMEAKGAKDQDIYKKRKEILNKELNDIATRFSTFSGDNDKQIELAEKFKDKKNELTALTLAFEKKTADDAKKVAKDKADKSLEYAEKEFKAQFELQKLSAQQRIDAQKAIADAEGINPAVRIAARLQQFEEERKMAVAERDFALRNTKLTASERELIAVQSLKKIHDLEQDAANGIIAIRKQSNDELVQAAEDTANALNAGLEAERNKRTAFLQGILDDSLRAIQQNANAQLQVELDRYSRGEISKETYEKNKAKIEADAQRNSLLKTIQYYEDLVKLANLSPDAEKDALKQLADYKQQLYDMDVKAQEEANEKKSASNEDFFKKYKEQLTQLGTEIENAVFSVLEGGIERQKNQIQDQIDLLEDQKQKDIEVADQTITNAQDKADAIAVINARADAQKQQLEKKQRQLDEQKAKFDRLRTIAGIVQNTAQGVTAALAEFPPNPVLAAIIGAIGAAQLVSVLAQPIPKYALGTDDHQGGLAIVGDGGKKEYVKTPDGNIYETPSTDTLVNLPAHTKVFKDEFELMNAMHAQHMRKADRVMTMPNDMYQFQNMTRSIDRLEKSVVHAIKNQPRPVYDGKPNLKGWVHGNGTTKYL